MASAKPKSFDPIKPSRKIKLQANTINYSKIKLEIFLCFFVKYLTHMVDDKFVCNIRLYDIFARRSRNATPGKGLDMLGSAGSLWLALLWQALSFSPMLVEREKRNALRRRKA